MKKKSLILMFAIAGLFASCNDAIDINQAGQVTDPAQIYKNSDDIKRGVLGIYALIPGESEIEFGSVFTDEVALGIANGGQGLISGEYGFFMQPGNDFAVSTWGGYYRIINQVNRLLNSIETLLVEKPAEAAAFNKSKAELLVLRAYANYKLFSYYTPDYTNPSGLSIMKLDFLQTSDYSKVIGRSTVSEIQKFILDDLAEAENVNAEAWGANIYVTQGLIDGIRTKLYSLVGDYPNVITSAQAVLADPKNQIGNHTEFEQYFNDVEISKEVIFQLQRVRGNASVASAWYSGSVRSTGQPFYEMGRSLYNQFDKLDAANTGQQIDIQRNDVRYKVNLLTISPNGITDITNPRWQGSKAALNYQSLPQAEYVETDILLIGKYKGRSSQNLPLQNNIPILRSADIYLAMAEARAGQGILNATATTPSGMYTEGRNGGSVQAILFFLRSNRSIDRNQVSIPTFANAQAAWKAILDERQVEFAFEGYRYLDMKRLGDKAGSVGFERYSKDCSVNGACNLPALSFKMTLPIPSTELNSNSIIRGQQNPGY